MNGLREHISALLSGKDAHLSFDEAVAALAAEHRGKPAPGAPHTAWELLEHMRIAQWDILEFSRNPKHVSPKWPEEYWPKTKTPSGSDAWERSVAGFRQDLEAMRQLVSDPANDLLARIPHGDGQTLLREALVLADHNSYHLGQLVFLRKLLEA
jgi:hypothetical protein